VKEIKSSIVEQKIWTLAQLQDVDQKFN